MLNLPALGQMNVGLLLRFLSLPLVGLHLHLQLVNQILQPGNIFLVLFSLVGELLYSPLIFADTLNSICSTSLFSLNLCLQLTHPRLEFLELLLATLHGQVLSLIQAVLQVLNSDLQVLLHPLQVSASVLLLLQLLSHHCSISDSLLGLVLCIPCFLNSVIHFTLDLNQVSLKLLSVQKACVLRVQKSNTLTGIHQLLLSCFAASLCLLQSSPKFLNFSHHETVSAIHHSSLFLEIILGSDSIIKVQLCVLQLCLHIPQLLLGLSSLSVGMAQLNLHLIQVSLHLLLDSQGIIPAPDLRIKIALHGVNHPLAVPLDLLHLLVLFCNLPVYLTFDLV